MRSTSVPDRLFRPFRLFSRGGPSSLQSSPAPVHTGASHYPRSSHSQCGRLNFHLTATSKSLHGRSKRWPDVQDVEDEDVRIGTECKTSEEVYGEGGNSGRCAILGSNGGPASQASSSNHSCGALPLDALRTVSYDLTIESGNGSPQQDSPATSSNQPANGSAQSGHSRTELEWTGILRRSDVSVDTSASLPRS